MPLWYPDKVGRLIAEVSPVPIYATAEHSFGAGVVGGVIKGGRTIGTRLGESARRILEGARANDIGIGTMPAVPTFDWRQIQRWRIDPSLLPPDSDIRFRTPTVWESYGNYIIAALTVVVAQLLLIAELLTQRTRRRRAEETIRAREATLRQSYEQIRHLAGHVIHAEEVTRSALARELHDGVCQQLAAVSMIVASLMNKSSGIQDPRTQEDFSMLQHETMGVFDEIRRLSHELHPATLRLLGLPDALRAHCREVSKRQAVHVTFKTEGQLGLLHPDTAASLFRIAQESIRNGIAHGHARRVAVTLARTGDDIEMTISDDGRGFDVAAVRTSGSGLGLVTMEERAHAVQGEVDIVSDPPKGTTIRIRCPALDVDQAVPMLAQARKSER